MLFRKQAGSTGAKAQQQMFIFSLPAVDIEVLLQHVGDIEQHVHRHYVGPLGAVVRGLVQAQQSKYLTHNHRVRDITVPRRDREKGVLEKEKIQNIRMVSLERKTDIIQ